MDRIRKRPLRALVAALAIGAACTSGTAVAAGAGATPALDWTDCGEGFLCATAQVPRRAVGSCCAASRGARRSSGSRAPRASRVRSAVTGTSSARS